AKLFLFLGALGVPSRPPLEDHVRLFRVLAVIGVINAAIGAWYYLRILAVMYLRRPVKPLGKPRAWPALVAIWGWAAVTPFFRLCPQPLARATREAVLPERLEVQRAERSDPNR